MTLFPAVLFISCSKSPSVPTPQKGKANVIGRVIWNEKPAENIEIILCSNYNFIFAKCEGKSYKEKSGSDGYFIFRDVDPGEKYVIHVNFEKENKFIYFCTKNTTKVEKFEVKEDKTLDIGEREILKPDFADAYFRRGDAYADSGKINEAINDYKTAILLNPAYQTREGRIIIN